MLTAEPRAMPRSVILNVQCDLFFMDSLQSSYPQIPHLGSAVGAEWTLIKNTQAQFSKFFASLSKKVWLLSLLWVFIAFMRACCSSPSIIKVSIESYFGLRFITQHVCGTDKQLFQDVRGKLVPFFRLIKRIGHISHHGHKIGEILEKIKQNYAQNGCV